jgi:preprotein translocase subunit SecE
MKSQAMSDDAGQPRENALWARIKSYPQRWAGFLHEVRLEMRQVTWPSRDDVVSTTSVVIVAVGFFALYFYGVDTLVAVLLTRLLGLFGHRG